MAEALEVEEILQALYERDGRPEHSGEDDILLTLIQTILSQATSRQNADQAFDDLMERFEGDLEAIRAASSAEVADAISVGGLSAQKAPRIQAILEQLHQERGELSMEYLHQLDAEEARGQLLKFKGVGPKSAAFVLMWAANMPLFPMNGGILRVAARLGWIEEGLSDQKAHAQVEPMIPPEERYAAHNALVRHARLRCHKRNPACALCPLQGVCPKHGL